MTPSDSARAARKSLNASGKSRSGAIDMANSVRNHPPTLDGMFRLFSLCNQSRTVTQFVDEVHPLLDDLIPHAAFICGTASTDDMTVVNAINVSFPVGYLNDISDAQGRIDSPMVRTWLETNAPVYYDGSCTSPWPYTVPPDWQTILQRHGLRNLASHGLIDRSAKVASYFCLGNLDGWDTRIEETLSIVVPHLHRALVNLCPQHTHAPSLLSSREREVLDLVGDGKTNRQVAQVLGISPWTIKVHMRNIMAKLEVSTRSHAVAKSIRLYAR
jgi:DNA-binding CsgD family transcriptional regulator